MKILFVAPKIQGVSPGRSLATFHQADVKILRSLGHEVDVLPWHGHPYFSLLKRAAHADLIYCWTIGDHTAIAMAVGKVARKPVLVVIGGYEFANIPDIHYGNLIHPRTRLWSRLTWKYADHLLFVDGSLLAEAYSAFAPNYVQSEARYSDGVMPLDSRTHIVPTGYDTDYWHPDGKKENMVLTVAHCPGLDTLSLKGVDTFLRVAKKFPKWEFHVAGELPPILRDGSTPPNVTLHGWVERNEVRRLMQRAKVYAQFSRHEGLPNAMAEAMSCGAIPVGTPVNGIPTLIGDTGFVVRPELAEQGVRGAWTLAQYASARESARRRIVERFPLSKRKESLERILKSLV